jgi:hypothetical protein
MKRMIICSGNVLRLRRHAVALIMVCLACYFVLVICYRFVLSSEDSIARLCESCNRWDYFVEGKEGVTVKSGGAPRRNAVVDPIC